MRETKNNRPLLVYDGDCSFCRLWIDCWKSLTEGRIEYAPFQDVASQFPEIPRENFVKSIQLIAPDGEVFSGAQAVFLTLASAPGKRWMLWVYQKIPGVAPVCECFYRFVAGHRNFFYKLTRFLWGKHLARPSHLLTRWLFLRLLGVVYFFAFLSLSTQIAGLVGRHGISPAGTFLQAVQENIGAEGYRIFPTLAWLNSSDSGLEFLAGGGALLSWLVILGIAPGPVLLILWLFYLSLVSVGRDFMSFQWDILLLEAGFLSIFLAPWRFWAPYWGDPPKFSTSSPPSPTILWLLRWLLFRLTFSSGAVKLLSGDPTWRDLTALNFHYETQPLPTPIAWYMNRLSEWFQEVSVGYVFVTELLVPFLIFAPRRLRVAAAALISFFQLLIALTGNYAFFNLLTVVLCLLLLDDAFLRAFFPERIARRLMGSIKQTGKARSNRFLIATLAFSIISASGLQMAGMFLGGRRLPKSATQILAWLAPFHIVNGYGLFAVMTTSRPEIVVEGSQNGETWLEYEFKYKPGDLKRPPPWVAPRQPRLDWQMWFAALGDYNGSPWFVNFMARLLEGSPEVLALLRRNPFPAAPPRYVRALLYDYHFTDFATRSASGNWWRRELKGPYFPVASLRHSGSGIRD